MNVEQKDTKRYIQKFEVSISIIGNLATKWKATGTVLVKGRCGRPRKIYKKAKVKNG